MADLQAEIELTVELRKFFNIDLFVQGYYQIRAGVKFAPRIQSASKIELKSELLPTSLDDSGEQIYPASIFNDWGVSKTFLIIYKNEEIELDDQFNFKLSVIVDAQNIMECFNRMDMQLCVELYFIEKDYTTEKLSTMQQLCSRCYKLHFNPRLGLHTHIPILFDYFHLSAVTTTIHASLLCLIPPYVFDRPNIRRTSLFSFLFGQDLAQITTDQLNPNLLDRAYHLHNNICEILLSAYESLQDFYEKMIQNLPSNEQKPIHDHQKCRQKLKNLSEKIKTLDDIHTIDNLAHAHIAQCSAENIMLWGQFIQTFGLHETPVIILSKEYHLKRVKRLSEGFFLRETSRINLLVNEGDTYNDFHDLVRNSAYYSRLPHLPIECVELDGIPDTLPIIIEEIYSPVDQQSTTILSSLDTKIKDEKLNEIRPNLSNTVDTTNIHSAPNTPPISHSKSIKQQTKTSTPIVRQSSRKSVLPFRIQSPTNINPVVALSNEPFVKLTSIRKIDPDNPSSTDSNSDPSLRRFFNQSDTNINHPKSNSTSLHQSLPNLSLQRTNSAITTNTDFLDSPVMPKFLSEKTDDEVFLTTDQNQVVPASEFGDSSMKSKVLRASYRGKVNTMDRRITKRNQTRSLSNPQTKYFITKTDEKTIETNPPVNYPLNSVLNLTLQLEKSSTDDIQRRHSISTDNVDPLLLNGLTDDENTLNLIERIGGYNKTDESDRIQTNSLINSQTIEYVVHKEKIKGIISSKYSSNLMFMSDYSNPISPIPYFSQESILTDSNGTHLIICVHGLDGNSGDLRLIKTYLELCLPSSRLDFLMSSSNHSSTFNDIDIMVKQLIDEIDIHIERYGLKPQRISFIGHSLGNLIVRATVSHERFQKYRKLLYTYLSLSGPHLGTLFNNSGLVNMGMWLMQKWKKSDSLSQMSFKDHIDPKQTYLYKLSKKPCLEFFKNILLIASPQDRYVPFHSARIEVCKAALKDMVYGSVYVEMITNLLEPILQNPSITFVRYNAFHNIPSGTNNIIGRAAHIAILDSELFVEKLILVSAAKYFK